MVRTRVLTLACSLLFAAPCTHAQSPTASLAPPDGPASGRGNRGGMHRGEVHGMGILPPGTWWKNTEIVASLNLTADQQKHMDDIFFQSRMQLTQMKASLEEEQLRLEPLLNADPLDQGRALAQASRIADLRAELEKTRARMLLSLRATLTPDQWVKLQAEKRMPRNNSGGPDGFRGHGGMNHSGPSHGPVESGPGNNFF